MDKQIRNLISFGISPRLDFKKNISSSHDSNLKRSKFNIGVDLIRATFLKGFLMISYAQKIILAKCFSISAIWYGILCRIGEMIT